MSEEGPRLTRAAHKRLKTELEELHTSGRKQMAERLQRARELGDLTENAEYHETKHQQGLMEARIRKLEALVRTAVIVEAPTAVDSAAPGTIVTLKSLDDGGEEVYLLASSSEERASGARTVTVGSPLGAALDGKHSGDRVEYQAPGGNFAYEVLKVEPWEGTS